MKSDEVLELEKHTKLFTAIFQQVTQIFFEVQTERAQQERKERERKRPAELFMGWYYLPEK